jgi:hypothetical protein
VLSSPRVMALDRRPVFLFRAFIMPFQKNDAPFFVTFRWCP